MTMPLVILAVLSRHRRLFHPVGIKAYYHGWSVDQLRATGQMPADCIRRACRSSSLLLGDDRARSSWSSRRRRPRLRALSRTRRAIRSTSSVLANKFYFDEFYDRSLVGGQQFFARFFNWIDSWILDGLDPARLGLPQRRRGRAPASSSRPAACRPTRSSSASAASLLIYFTLFAH